MITKTDFQLGGATDLVQYIKRDDRQQVPVKDHTGRKLDQEQLQKFIDASEEYGMERHFIIAPDPTAEFDPSEVDRNVRKVMNDWRGDHRGTQYVYAVHGHEDRPHAHVAVTGRKDALRMNKQDVMEFRERARDAFGERERLAERAKLPAKQVAASPQLASNTADETVTAQAERSAPTAEPSPEATADPEGSSGGLFSDLFGSGDAEPTPRPDANLGRSAGDNAEADEDPGPGGPGALESAIFGATRVAAEELSTDEQADDEDERERDTESTGDNRSEADSEAEPEMTAEAEPEAEYDYW